MGYRFKIGDKLYAPKDAVDVRFLNLKVIAARKRGVRACSRDASCPSIHVWWPYADYPHGERLGPDKPQVPTEYCTGIDETELNLSTHDFLETLQSWIQAAYWQDPEAIPERSDVPVDPGQMEILLDGVVNLPAYLSLEGTGADHPLEMANLLLARRDRTLLPTIAGHLLQVQQFVEDHNRRLSFDQPESVLARCATLAPPCRSTRS
jgi:hypothetical protein